jgi:AdoMet-dependent heme synthase
MANRARRLLLIPGKAGGSDLAMMNRVMNFDFNERPFIVIWEITRACSLACRHCRAKANNKRHPLELSTDEGFRFIEQVARARPTLFILTGGDPIRRADLESLVRRASGLGLHVSISPSATPEFAATDLVRLKDAGVQRMSISLDGASEATHDRFRGIKGTWRLTMEALANARMAGVPVQLNTTFTRQNLGEFDEFVRVLEDIRPAMWSVFQLVPTGRGKVADMLSPEEMEHLFSRLAELSLKAPYDIKTTEGQHYRRVLLQQDKGLGQMGRRSPLGINDGKGFVFVSHIGEIQPSGFLPISAGNVRNEELLDVYRNSPLFRSLRDPLQLKGKCGRCEFNRICGGSRARAYATTGDFLAEEPLCPYQPGRRESAAPVFAPLQEAAPVSFSI